MWQQWEAHYEEFFPKKQKSSAGTHRSEEAEDDNDDAEVIGDPSDAIADGTSGATHPAIEACNWRLGRSGVEDVEDPPPSDGFGTSAVGEISNIWFAAGTNTALSCMHPAKADFFPPVRFSTSDLARPSRYYQLVVALLEKLATS